MYSFLLLITTHPDIQQKAFEEILNVVGTSRLPTLDDQPSLPYLGAILRELHRRVLTLSSFKWWYFDYTHITQIQPHSTNITEKSDQGGCVQWNKDPRGYLGHV